MTKKDGPQRKIVAGMRTIGLGLPVEEVLHDLAVALEQARAAVLEAPPGAGKTTLVPLFLLEQMRQVSGKIIMLEPRRMAARAAASRMADLLGEKPGETVGYAMRFERRIGKATRIEVLTEGLFTRRLQQDPELRDVALVIFDEFHERSLDADLALTLCLDTKTAIRPDLMLLVMSATLESEALSDYLDEAPIVRSSGRSFPVETRYRPNGRETHLTDHVAMIVREALNDEHGSILAFLPGVGEIRRVAEQLTAPPGVEIFQLHGGLGRDQQLRAIAPSPEGRRKIVLTTNIAETSLTIDGVTVVVDAGLERRQVYSPRTGMSRLETVPISRASADQRRGRAGRTAPGICYRLWPEAEDRGRIPHQPPEIMEADLAPLALELVHWGVKDAGQLRWPTPPPHGAMRQAQETLRILGLFDGSGDLTDAGRRAASLPLHPRLAAMVLARPEATAVILAALMSGRDPWRHHAGCDIVHRIEEMRASPPGDILRIAKQLANHIGITDLHPVPANAGHCLAFAFPDRVAKRRHNDALRYQLANGRGACLARGDPLQGEDWLVIAEVDDRNADARIRLAAAIAGEDVEWLLADSVTTETVVEWQEREAKVVAVSRSRLGAITLREQPLKDVDPNKISSTLMDVMRKRGPNALPWTNASRQLIKRLELARRIEPELPDWSGDQIYSVIEPYLLGLRSLEEVGRLDLLAILKAALGYEQDKRLDTLAPETLQTPAGSRAKIDYLNEPPLVSGKLQAFFGLDKTPKILKGSLPLAIELLSPAGRPLQVTQDLEGFWKNGYYDVRKEMRGRYPKHPWPEDPLTAEATMKTRSHIFKTF